MNNRKIKRRAYAKTYGHHLGKLQYVLYIHPESGVYTFDELVTYAEDGTRMFGYEDDNGVIQWTREDEMPKGELGVMKGVTITGVTFGHER